MVQHARLDLVLRRGTIQHEFVVAIRRDPIRRRLCIDHRESLWAETTRLHPGHRRCLLGDQF